MNRLKSFHELFCFRAKIFHYTKLNNLHVHEHVNVIFSKCNIGYVNTPKYFILAEVSERPSKLGIPVPVYSYCRVSN